MLLQKHLLDIGKFDCLMGDAGAGGHHTRVDRNGRQFEEFRNILTQIYDGTILGFQSHALGLG